MHRSILITTILVIMMITIVTIIKITIDSPTFQLRKASASAWLLCRSDPGQLYQLCFRSSRAWNINIIQLLMFLIGSRFSWLYVHEDSDLVVICTNSRAPQLTCIYVDQEQVGWRTWPGIMDIDIMGIWPGTTHPHIQRGLQADHWPAFRAALPGLRNSSAKCSKDKSEETCPARKLPPSRSLLAVAKSNVTVMSAVAAVRTPGVYPT